MKINARVNRCALFQLSLRTTSNLLVIIQVRKLVVLQATCLFQNLFFRKLVACGTTTSQAGCTTSILLVPETFLSQAGSLRYNDITSW